MPGWGGVGLSRMCQVLPPNSFFRQVTSSLTPQHEERVRGQRLGTRVPARLCPLGHAMGALPLCGDRSGAQCSPTRLQWIWALAGWHHLQLRVSGAAVTCPAPSGWNGGSPRHLRCSCVCKPAWKVSQILFPDCEEVLTKMLIIWPLISVTYLNRKINCPFFFSLHYPLEE